LDELKRTTRDYPFLVLKTLDEVEVALQLLESDMEQIEGPLRIQSYAQALSGFANEPRMHDSPSAVGESRYVDAAKAARAGDRLWIAPGVSTSIAEWEVPGGMLYVGKSLPSNSLYGEPSFINTTLKAKPQSRPVEDESLGYWPSYSAASQGSRAIYINWLATGRKDPDIPIGFVFIFFYGLERRLLLDALHIERVQTEAPFLIAELERLIELYGNNRSFENYATQLLSIARLRFLKQRCYELPPPIGTARSEMPLGLLIPLGQLIADGKPIPAAWALAWCMSDEGTTQRKAAKRCPEEFARLFEAYYREKFADGLQIKPNKRRLKKHVRPASSGFAGGHLLEDDTLPDVSSLSAPVRQFRELVDRCMDDLDSYSRLLGRDPAARGTARAFALLPPAIAAANGGEEIDRLRKWAVGVIEGGGVAPAEEAMSRWPGAEPEKMSKREAVEFAQCLDKLGIGIEPDVRFGSSSPQPTGHIVLFPLPADHPSAPSQEYLAAMVLIHLAAMVATSDGRIREDEERHLEQHLEHALQLSDAERTRLTAHLDWLLRDQPGSAGLAKRLKQVSVEDREVMAGFAISVAGADGHIDPAEIKTLRKIYTLLDLDQDKIYADIHTLITDNPTGPATEPVTVRTGGPSATGFKLPARDDPETAQTPNREAVTLNMDLVKKRLEQTHEVSSLLAGIFTDDNDGEGLPTVTNTPDPQQPANHDIEQVSLIEGLDPAHSDLLRALGSSSSWTSDEFQILAEQHGLMPSGAMETLNEAAFDRCGEALLEGEELIQLNEEARNEMLS